MLSHRPSPRAITWVLNGICLFAVLVLIGCAGEQPTEPGGRQQAWGEAMFSHHCARCHQADRTASALTASDLLASHADGRQLYDLIRTTMPLDSPRSLPDRDYLAITAYLLEREGLLTLPSDERVTRSSIARVELGDPIFELHPTDEQGAPDG